MSTPDLDAIIPAFNSWLQEVIADPVSAISKAALVLLVTIVFSIRKRLGHNLADITDKTISQLTLLGIKWFSNLSFSLRYKKHIIYEHRVFNVCGLRTQGAFTLEVDKVYVGLRIAPSAHPNNPNGLTHHQALEGNRPIWDFLKQDFKILAVIGAPGCGKSTLLQHIALAFAANKHGSHGLSAHTPVFLFLREHIDKIVTDEINLAQLAQTHFSNEKRYPNLKPPANWFETQLNNGKAIVLLDGLDEVADVKKRQKISAWVDLQIITYHNCPFIVTSRPQGYLAAPLQQAHRLEIQPFSWSQVQEFAHSWYFQHEVLSFGKKDEGVINRAKHGADDLLMRLQQMPALNALTVNPLLLTMIAMVHRYRGQLPGRRVALYSEICDVLLEHRRAAIGVQDSLTAIQKRVALQPLAAAMMQRETREISTEDAIAIIIEPLKQIGISEAHAGELFLREIEAGSGLLNESENHKWSFAHLTFQEYLTACHWLKQPAESTWHELINQSWWHETIRLYVAQANANDIVQACLQQNSLPSLILATECDEEASELDAAIRQTLRTRLDENLESADKGLSQLATSVLLNRRLKNLQRLNDKTEIDSEFISCAEYQLFLNDTDKNYQPAHWQMQHFPQGMARQAVLGVRAADAQEFCEWLSQKTGDNYRLPTLEEIQQVPAVSNTQYHATWCLQQGSYELVWQQISDKNACLRQLAEIHSLPVQFGVDLLKKYDDIYRIAVYYFVGDLYQYSPMADDRIRARARALDFNLDYIKNFNLSDGDIVAFKIELLSNKFISIFDRIFRHFLVNPLIFALRVDFARAQNISIALEQKLNLDLALDFNIDHSIIINLARKRILLELETLLSIHWMNFCDSLEPELIWIERLIFWKKYKVIDTALLRDVLLTWFWAFKIIDARIEGGLPAWEGIRIVREQAKP
ncbi:MAG: NACHT domain-containing protein [Methylococcales bacterium]